MIQLWIALVLLSTLLVACTRPPRPSKLIEAEGVRKNPSVLAIAEFAPAQIAEGDHLRKAAEDAYEKRDHAASVLYAEWALAAYEHAFAVARLVRASKQLAEAEAADAESRRELAELAITRRRLEQDGTDLENGLRIRRESMASTGKGAVDPQREAARLLAARALATEARLLCGSARLLSPTVAGLADREKDLSELEKRLDGPEKRASIDTAGRVRADCLALLTRARRDHDVGDAADALLAELSAVGKWNPSRDERGVVVTLRKAFHGTALAPESESALEELGKIAAAHPNTAIQVVVHDATRPTGEERAADRERADAAVRALVAGGAPPDKTTGETAGASAPVVDPSDARYRERNARLDVVFVTLSR